MGQKDARTFCVCKVFGCGSTAYAKSQLRERARERKRERERVQTKEKSGATKQRALQLRARNLH